MKTSLSTLCYIERDGAYLMLHRTKKEADVNAGKWIGVGGHFEEGESPEECLLREVREETGYTLTSYRFRGIITFVYHADESAGTGTLTHFSTHSEQPKMLEQKRVIVPVPHDSSASGTIVEYMHLFTADTFTGDPVPCDEGELKWVPKDDILNLNLWEGDRIFLKLLAEDAPFFSLKLVYDSDDNLIEQILNGG